MEKTLDSMETKIKCKQWLKTDCWLGFLKGLCFMPMVEFIYTHLRMYRQSNAPNGVHTWQKNLKSSCSIIETQPNLDENTHDVLLLKTLLFLQGKANKRREGRKVNGGHGSYLVNWRSLASMLRCLMHILVSAEPMSLVAPGNTKKIDSLTETHTDTAILYCLNRCYQRGSLHIDQRKNTKLWWIFTLLLWVSCMKSKHCVLQTDEPLPSFCILLHWASTYTRDRSASRRHSTHPCFAQIK